MNKRWYLLFFCLWLTGALIVGCSKSDITGHSISGTISTSNIFLSGTHSLGGVTVMLSGAATGTAVSGDNGTFTFSNLNNGVYTVTPSLSGYDFSPSSAEVTVNGADESASFLAVVQPIYSISGYVLDGSGPAGLADVIVTLYTGNTTTTGSAATDTSGYYEFTSLRSGNYWLGVSKSGFTFYHDGYLVTNTWATSIYGADVTDFNFNAYSQ